MKSTTLWFLCLAAVILGILFGIGALERSSEQAAAEPSSYASDAQANRLTFRLLDESEFVPTLDEFGRAVPAVDGENLVAGDKAFKSETVSIELDVDGSVEYKALMDQGDTLVYAWQASKGDVYYDFHAHPPDADADFFTRYKAGEGRSDRGTVLAAYGGQHGWFWLNLSDNPVTIELEVAGFYDEVVELSLY